MFVQGHGQKSEQKHRTKNFAKLPNHLPLLMMLTMVQLNSFARVVTKVWNEMPLDLRNLTTYSLNFYTQKILLLTPDIMKRLKSVN